jgi:type II secretory pathway component PulM
MELWAGIEKGGGGLKTYLSKLNPSERRFVVGVALVFFLVINIFWVWPHFSDWSNLQRRLAGAQGELAKRETAIQQAERLKPEVDKMQRAGANVPPEDQAVQFLRTIQTQAAQNGVGVTGNGRLITRTNQFFMEQIQTITVQSGEKQLVDFLYNLGSGDSLVRVRDLSVRPDQNRQQLAASITLIASYQKNPKTTPAPAPAATPKSTLAVAPKTTPAAAPKTTPPAGADISKPVKPKIK